MDLFKALKDVITSQGERNDDDVADRMSYRSTVFVLVIFILYMVAIPLLTSHIACWCPAHFSLAQVEYTNQYCWSRGTYKLPFDKEVPRRRDHNDVNGTAADPRHFVSYYQWVPYILLALAASCLLPIGVWRGWNTSCGIDVCNVVEGCEKFTHRMHSDPKKPDVYLAYVVASFQRFLAFGGRCYKYHVTLLYAGVKVMFMATAALQLVLLNVFLGDGYYGYVYIVVHSLLTTGEWPAKELPGFPLVTMCDFYVRRLGNVQRYSVQCALTSNFYYEKIFVFIWCWLMAALLLHAYRAVFWLVKLRNAQARTEYIGSRLNVSDNLHNLPSFTSRYLRLDGCFLLMLIEHNTDRLTIREILRPLWKAYINTINGDLIALPQKKQSRADAVASDNVGNGHVPQVMRKRTRFADEDAEDSLTKRNSFYGKYKRKSGREIEEVGDSDHHASSSSVTKKGEFPQPSTPWVTPTAPLIKALDVD